MSLKQKKPAEPPGTRWKTWANFTGFSLPSMKRSPETKQRMPLLIEG